MSLVLQLHVWRIPLPLHLSPSLLDGRRPWKQHSHSFTRVQRTPKHTPLFFAIAPSSVCKSFKLLATISHFIPPNLTLSFPKIHHRHCIVAMFSIQYTVNSSPEAQMRLICALMRPVLLGKPLLCCIIVMTKHLLGR